MKYIEFKKYTDENGAQPIYLFEGEEVYFREKGEALLKSRYLQEKTLDYATFDGGSLKGDKIKAFSGDTKTLKKLFNERKTPVKEREYLPLIADGVTGEVYAVCGVEISQKIKVDENTKEVLYISIRKRGNA